MKKLFSFIIIATLFASCKPDKEALLTKTWQAIDLENPQLEADIKDREAFLDTVGQHTTPEENFRLYGISNIDSIRTVIHAQLDESKMMQQYALENTNFEFRKDKVAVLNFGSSPDSANWYIDDDGALILDDMKLKGAGDKTKMEIIELSDTLLKLRYTEDSITSTATFRPAKK